MVNLYNITNLSGTSTFTMSPAPGRALAASQFTTIGATSFYSSITFSDSGEPNAFDNTVIGTINWITQPINSDQVLPAIDLSSVQSTILPRSYESVIDIYHDKASVNADDTNYIGIFTFLSFSTYDESTGKLTITGSSGVSYGGLTGMWPLNAEDGQVFTFTYTVSSSNFASGDVQVAPWGDSISSDYINLDMTNGTHSVDITVNGSRRANAFYISSINDAGKSGALTAMSLTRKIQQNEVVSFTNVNPNLTISSDILTTSTTQSRFNISGFLEGEQDHELYTVKLSTYNGTYYTDIPQLIASENASTHHYISNPTIVENANGQNVSKSSTVNWYADSNVSYEDNNNFAFGQDTTINQPSAQFTVPDGTIGFQLLSAAGDTPINFTSTTAGNTIAITAGGSFLSAPTSVGALFNTDSDFGTGSFSLTTTQNTTGSDRAGTITLTNEFNTSGTPDQTFNVTQAATGDAVIFSSGNITLQTNSASTEVVSDAAFGDYVVVDSTITVNNQGVLESNDVNISITTGDANWLTLNEITLTSELPNGVKYYNVSFRATVANTGSQLTTRAAAVSVTHPSGSPSVIFNVTQNFFNPVTDTLTIHVPGGTNFGVNATTATLRITSSQTGTPLPTVMLGTARLFGDPLFINNQFFGQSEIIDSFVTLGDIEVVTGQPYTHKVTLNISDFIQADANDLKSQQITVYHQNDLNQTTPDSYSILQGSIYNPTETSS